MTTARSLYAAEGLEVSMATIARAAGVGKATLSRHFTTPEALIEAVFIEHMQEYVVATEEALMASDPWAAFTAYVLRVCEMQAEDRGFATVLTLVLSRAPGLEQLRARAHEGFLELIDRARATGHLREDFASEDLVLVLLSNAAVVAATAATAPDAWRRLAGHFLRAFATPGAPLPSVSAPPTSAALYEALGRRDR